MRTKDVPLNMLYVGDRVLVPGGVVRTVESIKPSMYLNRNGETIWTVRYVEGDTPEWSSGNSGIETTVFKVVLPETWDEYLLDLFNAPLLNSHDPVRPPVCDGCGMPLRSADSGHIACLYCRLPAIIDAHKEGS